MKIRTIIAAAVMAAVSFTAFADNAAIKAEKENILKQCVTNPDKPAGNTPLKYSCRTVCMSAVDGPGCKLDLDVHDCLDKGAPPFCRKFSMKK